jgi:hypothetical protein
VGLKVLQKLLHQFMRIRLKGAVNVANQHDLERAFANAMSDDRPSLNRLTDGLPGAQAISSAGFESFAAGGRWGGRQNSRLGLHLPL